MSAAEGRDRHSNEGVWDVEEVLSMDAMDARIRNMTSFPGWRRAIRLLSRHNIPVEGMRVAEVGCGTGTFSLVLGLLGASVTLIDYNRKVLNATEAVYGAFGCPARFVHADCLQAVPAGLDGAFDLVFSGGVAEHFTGAYRERCFGYHLALLRAGGIVSISVPNRLSPMYRLVTSFRRLTGTMDIDLEAPFTRSELLRLAEKAGLREAYVAGNTFLGRDVVDYSLGMISATLDLLPAGLRKKTRGWKSAFKEMVATKPGGVEATTRYCRRTLGGVYDDRSPEPRSVLADRFSAGLILFGIK